MLLLPNEVDDSPGQVQRGPRDALAALAADGRVDAVEVVSFLQVRAADPDGWADHLVDVAEGFGPDVIVWQHVEEGPLPTSLPARLAAVSSRPLLVYQDGDAYGVLRKPIPPAMATVVAAADLVLAAGGGAIARAYRRAGAARVRLMPPVVDARFAGGWEPSDARPDEVVMIASRVATRVPAIPALPGGLSRDRLVRGLHRAFGAGFALYGRGWDSPSARGPIAYTEQHRVLRDGWVSVGWNHFPRAAFAASDRLPIAMSAGVVHVTNRIVGAPRWLAECPGVLMAGTPGEAVELVRIALSLPRDELIRMGEQAREVALEHLDPVRVWAGALDVVDRLRGHLRS
ncbi:hypothetical protein [Euzebya sp.]|uniref:glycosyltransferase family protein n=1 Tax=Euzebya sp. TaxID=1971409 RepID=UPI003513F8A8